MLGLLPQPGHRHSFGFVTLNTSVSTEPVCRPRARTPSHRAREEREPENGAGERRPESQGLTGCRWDLGLPWWWELLQRQTVWGEGGMKVT